jgi:hypothetical protein
VFLFQFVLFKCKQNQKFHCRGLVMNKMQNVCHVTLVCSMRLRNVPVCTHLVQPHELSACFGLKMFAWPWKRVEAFRVRLRLVCFVEYTATVIWATGCKAADFYFCQKLFNVISEWASQNDCFTFCSEQMCTEFFLSGITREVKCQSITYFDLVKCHWPLKIL